MRRPDGRKQRRQQRQKRRLIVAVGGADEDLGSQKPDAGKGAAAVGRGARRGSSEPVRASCRGGSEKGAILCCCCLEVTEGHPRCSSVSAARRSSRLGRSEGATTERATELVSKRGARVGVCCHVCL